jgi:enoyl-CoA hydratase/carnithine racemase
MAEGDFSIGLPEVRIGLPVPPVIYTALGRLVGSRLAERLCVEGKLISPQEAERIGLVDGLAAPSTVIAAALAWCQEMVTLPPRALRLTRAAARRELAHAFAEFGWEELDELAAGWSGEETQRAIRAWLDRRRDA